ncbi:hypothetical protein VE23_14100 [Paenibacillus sp. D9]|uniref:hypothetical protein n=1 Tax=Paenibacillus sp. D9 TaxID=665792 RepID=UPI00061EC597|nr:hypothetical protein [Paenibacillus sp. D9]KKC47984.1 hypothetical protein VE23_14100 [Paenibacillus sp. D9]
MREEEKRREEKRREEKRREEKRREEKREGLTIRAPREVSRTLGPNLLWNGRNDMNLHVLASMCVNAVK